MFPNFVVSLYYFLRYGAKISLRAEVDLTQNLRFGPDCVVSSFTKIKAREGPLTIGARSGFASGCFVSTGEKGTIIGDNFICGPNSVISSSNYAYEKLNVHLDDQDHMSKGVRIGSNVWIGAGSIILDGTVLRDNTIVVANSLVNRRYPPNCILQGSPAKVIMKRTADN